MVQKKQLIDLPLLGLHLYCLWGAQPYTSGSAGARWHGTVLPKATRSRVVSAEIKVKAETVLK